MMSADAFRFRFIFKLIEIETRYKSKQTHR